MEFKWLLFGAIAGMAGGALLVANSNKAKQVVKEGQDMVVEKVTKLKQNSKK